MQLPQDTAGADGTGRGLDGGEVGDRGGGDVEKFRRYRLPLGVTDPAHHVHRLGGVRSEHRGHRRRGLGHGAVERLPGFTADAVRPFPLLGGDGDAHARRGHGGPDTAPALQSAFEFELLQGLPERRSRDTEPRREFPLVGQDLPTAKSESSASLSTVLRCQYFGSCTDSSCVVPTLSSAIAGRRFRDVIY